MGRRYQGTDLVTALITLTLVGTVYLIYRVLRLGGSIVGGVVCTYRDLGFATTVTARLLWAALVVFVGVTVVSLLAASAVPASAPIDAAAVCIGFGLWSVVVAICSWRGAKLLADLGLVDSYVSYSRKGGRKSR